MACAVVVAATAAIATTIAAGDSAENERNRRGRGGGIKSRVRIFVPSVELCWEKGLIIINKSVA